MNEDEIKQMIVLLQEKALNLEEVIQSLLTAPRVDRYELIYLMDQQKQLCNALIADLKASLPPC